MGIFSRKYRSRVDLTGRGRCSFWIARPVDMAILVGLSFERSNEANETLATAVVYKECKPAHIQGA